MIPLGMFSAARATVASARMLCDFDSVNPTLTGPSSGLISPDYGYSGNGISSDIFSAAAGLRSWRLASEPFTPSPSPKIFTLLVQISATAGSKVSLLGVAVETTTYQSGFQALVDSRGSYENTGFAIRRSSSTSNPLDSVRLFVPRDAWLRIELEVTSTTVSARLYNHVTSDLLASIGGNIDVPGVTHYPVISLYNEIPGSAYADNLMEVLA